MGQSLIFYIGRFPLFGDQTVMNRKECQLQAVVNAQFVEDVGHVVLHGLLAD